MSHLTNYDVALHLELAEHAYLMGHGWHWAIFPKPYADISGSSGSFVWVPPPWHKGSKSYYESREHAINSAKRHRMGWSHNGDIY